MAPAPHNCKHECNEWVVSWTIDGTGKSLGTIFNTSFTLLSRHLQDIFNTSSTHHQHIFNHPPPAHTPIQTQMDTLAYTRNLPQYVAASCLRVCVCVYVAASCLRVCVCVYVIRRSMWLQLVFICGCNLCSRHIQRGCCYPKSSTHTITDSPT